MEFRDVAGGRSVQRPAIDDDDLAEERAALKGEFTHEDKYFAGGDQAGISGEGALRRCLLNGVDLSGSILRGLDLLDVRLENVDLSNAGLHANTARRVEMLNCRAIGLRLSLDHAGDFYAQETRLDYAVIEVGRAKGLTVFDGCSFRDAVLTGDLSGVVFYHCDLTNAEFAANRAQDCDLRGSRLNETRGLLSLRGAKISPEQAVAAAGTLAAEAGLIIEL